MGRAREADQLTDPLELDALVFGRPGMPRAVLLHGDVSGAEATWSRQEPLGEGFHVIAPDRRGYGASPPGEREDFDVDAVDVIALLGEGAHLAGHSYGGVVALVAAARRPELVRSLCLIEPPAFAVARDVPAVAALLAEQNAHLARGPELSDEDFLAGFIASVGGDPGRVPRPLTPLLAQHTRVLRGFRHPAEAEVDLAALAQAAIPTLVVSGGHSAAFEAICDAMAEGLGAERITIPGAQHNVPRMAAELNAALAGLWAGGATRRLLPGAGAPVLLVDSISALRPGDEGRVVVSGSHGGVSAGELARGRGLRAAFFNDAGVGKDGAGVAALAMLDAEGTPAGAVDHRSARIGDARDAWRDGVLSHVNAAAEGLGLAPGERLRAAVARAFGSPGAPPSR
jgi:pimeloyl-ACP methyl ester carboxylesterase